MEKIAVHCPTNELFDRVKEKSGAKLIGKWYDSNAHIRITNNGSSDFGFCHTLNWYQGKGYNIITAKKYLGSKVVKSKPKTKESKMNETIRKVFKDDTLELAEKMEENFSDEITMDFTGELLLTEYKQKYIDEIKRREEEAKKEEAK